MSSERPLVFVIDDDRAVRDSLKFALKIEGLEVETCEGGPGLLAVSAVPLAPLLERSERRCLKPLRAWTHDDFRAYA